MSRRSVLSDAQWETIEPLLPAQRPWSGRPRRDHRQVVEGIIYRYRCGIAWRDVPNDFGPWQTVWKRHRAWAADGDRKSTRLNSSHVASSYAVFCLKKKKKGKMSRIMNKQRFGEVIRRSRVEQTVARYQTMLQR